MSVGKYIKPLVIAFVLIGFVVGMTYIDPQSEGEAQPISTTHTKDDDLEAQKPMANLDQVTEAIPVGMDAEKAEDIVEEELHVKNSLYHIITDSTKGFYVEATNGIYFGIVKDGEIKRYEHFYSNEDVYTFIKEYE